MFHLGFNEPGKEGTMCTAFSCCRVYQQCLRVWIFYAIQVPGSSPTTPWALRPERLQWFMRPNPRFGSGKRGQGLAQIAAFFGLAGLSTLVSLSTVTPAQAGAQLPFGNRRKLDSRLRGNDGGVERGMNTPNHAGALALFHCKRLIWLKALAGTFPSILFQRSAVQS